MPSNRVRRPIGRTTNLTASRGNAGRNRAQSLLRDLRESSSRPDTIYSRNGSDPMQTMNAAQRRQWASAASGQALSNRIHVSFTRDRSRDRVTTSGGIRRTLEGYRVVYTYS